MEEQELRRKVMTGEWRCKAKNRKTLKNYCSVKAKIINLEKIMIESKARKFNNHISREIKAIDPREIRNRRRNSSILKKRSYKVKKTIKKVNSCLL